MRDVRFIDQPTLITALARGIDDAARFGRRFTVLSAFCDALPEIWHMLSEAERARFRKHHARAFAAAAFPCPPQNGARMHTWLRSGRVAVRGTIERGEGRACPIRAINGGFEVRYRDGTTNRISHVINATGLSYDLRSQSAPRLFRTLVNSGIVVANGPHGAKVDFDTGKVLDHDDTPREGLYIVGPLTNGVHLVTNSVAKNARAANRAVAAIVGEAAPSWHRVAS